MPRLPRYIAPGQPHHIIQRGNNRSEMFCRTADFEVFRDILAIAIARHKCLVHAYVFMTNHVHLLVTPQKPESIPKVMQSVGRRYVHYFNRRYDRTGTLWEGRYRATLVNTEKYLLTCYRYIELNPVRAGMTAHPADYRWSSYGANALGLDDPLVTPHERFLALDLDPIHRQQAYQALFRVPLENSTLQEIRTATNTSWALGDEEFRRTMTRSLNRRAAPLPRGRPWINRVNGVRVEFPPEIRV